MSSDPMASSPAVPGALHPAVAPVWHTVIVLAVLLGLSFIGAHSGHLPGTGPHGRAPGYVLIMAIEWILAAFIWYGARRRGTRLSDLVGGSWARP